MQGVRFALRIRDSRFNGNGSILIIHDIRRADNLGPQRFAIALHGQANACILGFSRKKHSEFFNLIHRARESLDHLMACFHADGRTGRDRSNLPAFLHPVLRHN